MIARAGEAARFGFLLHSHMLRHGCGYKLANDGQDTRAIQHHLGHRSIASTVRLHTARAGSVQGVLEGLRTPQTCWPLEGRRRARPALMGAVIKTSIAADVELWRPTLTRDIRAKIGRQAGSKTEPGQRSGCWRRVGRRTTMNPSPGGHGSPNGSSAVMALVIFISVTRHCVVADLVAWPPWRPCPGSCPLVFAAARWRPAHRVQRDRSH